jgi:signal transduction histidine kinase
LLQKRGKMRGAVLRKALNTDLESGVFSRYEALSASAERLLTLKRQESQRKIEQSTRIIIVLMVIPIFLASLLLVFSRIFLKRAIARPLAGILRATAEISAGHLHYRAPTASGTAELATLAGAINQMADELSRSQEALVRSEKQAAQGALVQMLANNISNPLASIRATAQMADEPDLPQETRQALTDIMGAVDRLERWTGAMLAYLHPLKPQLAEASLQEIIRGALAPLQQKLREKRLTLEWTPGEPIDLVAVDEHLLEQALYNLLLNAADAAPPGSAIGIACQRDAAGVVLRILDRGPGMPFTPESGSLHPAPSSKRFGTGLGIPFAFKVCEALGGSLTFKPRPGGGTEVRLTLPDSPHSMLQARL